MTLVAGLCPALSGRSRAAVVDYDVVYVRQPRFGDLTNTIWPEVRQPARADPGADLMLLHPDGTEEVLARGGNGSVTDPFVSFDGESVYFSYFHDLRPTELNTQRSHLPYRGADIFRIHLPTRKVVQLTFGGFTPNTGAGTWDESNPVNPSIEFNRLGYGILNLGPCPIPGGRIVFTSNRNGFEPTKGGTAPTLQLFVMDEDGKNVEPIAPMTISSALHPTILRDGRIAFSSHEDQGLRDQRLWGIWAINPDGRNWSPIVSSFSPLQAAHFMTQMSNEDFVYIDYYNLNNNGFGAARRMPIRPPEGQPAFHGAPLVDNPGIWHSVGQTPTQFRMPFTPRGLHSITSFTNGQDRSAPLGANGARVGKVTHPSAAPGGDLLLVWTPGPANNISAENTPRYDGGIYLQPQGEDVSTPAALIELKNSTSYNEAWPRAVVPYADVHGVDQPAQIAWLPNDGTLHAELPPGTPYGLIGTSSFYKRETFPGDGGTRYDGLDVFNTSENDQSMNWITQGAEAGKYSHSEIWAVRLVAQEPNTHRSYGPNAGREFVSHAMERLRILGEIPLRKFGAGGAPILDPEGNPDTSFLAKVPADTPFTFQTIDRHGVVLNSAQTWHQVRPGEVRTDCGGCHAHSSQPLAFESTAAGRPDYQVWDLTDGTPLLTRTADGQPGLKVVHPPMVNVEFLRDIRPVLERSCVSCHSGSSPAGNLRLDDQALYTVELARTGDALQRALPGDYARLAHDQAAKWGYKAVAAGGRWRVYQASRYLRMFQSRRSLLTWKVFGKRMDGWTNANHPTETVPGDPTTLPAGALPNNADLDYVGTCPAAQHLTEDEKMTFARWIDLGAPINLGPYGWFLDDLKPTVHVDVPRAGLMTEALTRIRFGLADANSGVDLPTLSVVASFDVGCQTPVQQLAHLAVEMEDGIYEIQLPSWVRDATRGWINVSVEDRQGNVTRVDRTFWSAEALSSASSLLDESATGSQLADRKRRPGKGKGPPWFRTATPTRTAAAPGPSPTPTRTSTPGPSRTPTPGPSRTPTRTSTAGSSPTPTRTATPRPSRTPMPGPSPTATATPTPPSEAAPCPG